MILKMQELYKKVSKDELLQEKYAKIMNAEKSNKETAKKLIDFAKDAGFDVTIEEIQSFFKEISEKKEEISEAELDMVAGGKGGGSVYISTRTLICPAFL